MYRPSRIRRIAKWTGVGVCVMLSVAWGVSEFASIVYLCGRSGIFVIDGHLAIDWSTVPYPSQGWSRYPSGSAAVVVLPCLLRSVRAPGSQIAPAILVPLYLPLLIIAIPTVYLFYRDRGPPRGHCRGCGYNLTGNESGVCPECGNRIVGGC